MKIDTLLFFHTGPYVLMLFIVNIFLRLKGKGKNEGNEKEQNGQHNGEEDSEFKETKLLCLLPGKKTFFKPCPYITE